MKRRLLLGTGLAALAAGLVPQTALAHGFGNRYDLPVPLGLYVSGAGAAVALSFVLIGLFARGGFADGYPRKNLLDWGIGRLLANTTLIEAVKALSAALFLLYLVAGLFGSEVSSRNLAPTMTWVVLWVGVAYFSALVGNVWALINPWKILFGYAERLMRRVTGSDLALNEPYPTRLGAWPAVVLFFAFAWVELVYQGSPIPFNLAMLTLIYSAITFAGMAWFGRDVWLRNGEMFTVAFGYLSALAPTELRVRGVDDSVNDYEAYGQAIPEDREWNVRPWGVGLLAVSPPTISHAALLVLMLSTVTFDGLIETAAWTSLLINVASALSLHGARAFQVITTAGLILLPTVFFAVFAATAWLMRWLADSRVDVSQLIRVFVYSLVPIAFAYHIAHFFGFLMIQGQLVVPLLSDPFGWGWDLFGTAGYQINIAVVNARFLWFLGVAAIVLGHVLAVYVAHVYAMRMFPKVKDAIRSQYPMMALMVGYTMLSLWIIAQPIVAH